MALGFLYGLYIGVSTVGLRDIWAVVGFTALVAAFAGAGSMVAERRLERWLVPVEDQIFGGYYENTASVVLASGWIFPFGFAMAATVGSIFFAGLRTHILWGSFSALLASLAAFVVFWVVYYVANSVVDWLLARVVPEAKLVPSHH
ncbi:MAG: hypothetical protein HYW37_00385 [Candidatus Colwellbacteria bacterium]|nr:hypothetical protein [Candidatus Colwellbacteria bacterium]